MKMSFVSVIMPTFKQERFIRRALDSLFRQELSDWDLLIIDDGSPDETLSAVEPFLEDPRLSYYRLDENRGLGAALNFGLERARSPLIAYLPSDDIFYANHLASLAGSLEQDKSAVLACSGIRHHYNRTAKGQMEGYPLQLVQVMHRQTGEKWIERDELVTDDLDRMFWGNLRSRESFIQTRLVTCEWVDHPRQRHKIIREPEGGINTYRAYYSVKNPLRFHSTQGNYMDENEHYRRFRERADTPAAADGLKILLVGELAYNPERILALEERGHQLYGLWMDNPYWYNSIGPQPFGHVRDIPWEDWHDSIQEIKPDVIYALLNWQAVPFAHRVLKENPGIPFVWHFKEGPFICLEKGTWDQLIDLYLGSDGQIYTSPEMRDWFETIVPGISKQENILELDGDLPKEDWFHPERSTRISEIEGEIHTVVPGRPIGLHPHNVVELAEQKIHLHFYGDFIHGQWLEWIEKTRRLAGDYIHLHSQVDQEDWVTEFSKYDAGWLHYFESMNHGELHRSNWDDLNYPARISTLAAAGLPVLQRDNSGHIVATQNLVRQMDIGLFFSNMLELRTQLEDKRFMERIRTNVWQKREMFTFDYHVDRLVDFFRQVIDHPGSSRALKDPQHSRQMASTTNAGWND
jgi:glycosyltransferase involved in cell wall biosynthesis